MTRRSRRGSSGGGGMSDRQSAARTQTDHRSKMAQGSDAAGRFAAAGAGALRGSLRDDGPLYAAALAYYALFSLFPLLLVAALVYASVVSQDRVVSDAARLVHGYVPDRTVVERTVGHVVAHRGSVGVGAVAFLLIGA